MKINPASWIPASPTPVPFPFASWEGYFTIMGGYCRAELNIEYRTRNVEGKIVSNSQSYAPGTWDYKSRRWCVADCKSATSIKFTTKSPEYEVISPYIFQYIDKTDIEYYQIFI